MANNEKWASFRGTPEYENAGPAAKAIAEISYLWEMAKQALKPKPKEAKYIERKKEE